MGYELWLLFLSPFLKPIYLKDLIFRLQVCIGLGSKKKGGGYCYTPFLMLLITSTNQDPDQIYMYAFKVFTNRSSVRYCSLDKEGGGLILWNRHWIKTKEIRFHLELFLSIVKSPLSMVYIINCYEK